MTNPDIRRLTADDIDALLAIQRACYGEGFEESGDVFARRLAHPAHGSLALVEDGALCAYLAAYRSVFGKVTPLHGDFEALAQADTLYLHDMAVAPAHAGRGLAHQLLQALWREPAAQGLTHAALVAVQGSQGYWARHGFAVQALDDPLQRERLSAYGSGAVYMARTLP